MSDIDLEAIRKRAEEATFPGPITKPRCRRCSLEVGECPGHREVSDG